MAFDQSTADAICAKLAEGKSLRKACRDLGGPDPSTILNWCEASADFAQQYARARQLGYQLLADELVEIADDDSGDTIETENGPKANPEFAARSRLRLDTRKWMLSKMLPKIYGEKLDLNHSGAVKFERIEAVIIDPNATGSVQK